jgi:hypothetical protein
MPNGGRKGGNRCAEKEKSAFHDSEQTKQASKKASNSINIKEEENGRQGAVRSKDLLNCSSSLAVGSISLAAAAATDCLIKNS